MLTKEYRDPDYVRPKPFDYKNKRYGLFYECFDNTFSRFDENSKIVVVEGPVASGKSKLAKVIYLFIG